MEKKIKFFVLVGVVCLWWFGSFFINKLFLPSPIDVFKMTLETLKSGLLVESFFSSFWRITVATLYSGIFAILIASLVVNSKTLEKIIVPITATSRYIPVTVFYPLLIMWLGIGENMKITFLFLATFLFFLPTTILQKENQKTEGQMCFLKQNNKRLVVSKPPSFGGFKQK